MVVHFKGWAPLVRSRLGEPCIPHHQPGRTAGVIGAVFQTRSGRPPNTLSAKVARLETVAYTFKNAMMLVGKGPLQDKLMTLTPSF